MRDFNPRVENVGRVTAMQEIAEWIQNHYDEFGVLTGRAVAVTICTELLNRCSALINSMPGANDPE